MGDPCESEGREEAVSVWNVGPFDNDDAVDWCAQLEATPPTDRAQLIRRTLEDAATMGLRMPLSTAAAAVAASATVLQVISGRQKATSPYAPRFLFLQDEIRIEPALRRLAVKVLDLVAADGSPWRRDWDDDIEADDAIEMLRELRRSLATTRH